ncbi:MAG: ATP-grasp domain-containing protein [Nitrospirae bacterium]|nr:ATP-grasp domain-containing protein [Nitrospirota bacterium]
MPRVLILDGMWNKTLAAVRSLGRRGFYVAVGEWTRFATALFSNYCSKRLIYPSPKERPAKFLDWLEDELKKNKYDVLMPMEFTTQTLITSQRERLSKYCRIPFAGVDLAFRLHNKAFLMKYAREKGFDIPKTYIIDDLGQLTGLVAELPFPVVIKPQMSSGARGIRYVNRGEDFVKQYKKVHKQYEFPIVQELIPDGGEAMGVCLLLNNDSEVRASFVYKRLREYPVRGGPSTLRASIKRDDVRYIAESLLRYFKWTGVAHIEFKVDPRDGAPKLLEINPRFWGSLQLAINAGVDFPYLLYRLAMDGDIDPVTEYKTGVMCRWIIPGDLLHFIMNPNRFHMRPGFFDMTIKDDLLSLRDPMPVIGRLASALTLLYNKEMQNLFLRR